MIKQKLNTKFKIPKEILNVIERAEKNNGLLYNPYYKDVFVPYQMRELIAEGALLFNPNGWSVISLEEAIKRIRKEIIELNIEIEKIKEKVEEQIKIDNAKLQ